MITSRYKHCKPLCLNRELPSYMGGEAHILRRPLTPGALVTKGVGGGRRFGRDRPYKWQESPKSPIPPFKVGDSGDFGDLSAI